MVDGVVMRRSSKFRVRGWMLFGFFDFLGVAADWFFFFLAFWVLREWVAGKGFRVFGSKVVWRQQRVMDSWLHSRYGW